MHFCFLRVWFVCLLLITQDMFLDIGLTVLEEANHLFLKIMAAESSALKFFCQSFVLFLSQVMCLRVSAAHLSHISSWPDPCWRHGAARKSWLLANRLDHGTHVYKEKLSWDGIEFSSWAFFSPRTAQIHMLRCTPLECQGRRSRSVSHHALCCFKHQPLRINSAAFTAKQTC